MNRTRPRLLLVFVLATSGLGQGCSHRVNDAALRSLPEESRGGDLIEAESHLDLARERLEDAQAQAATDGALLEAARDRRALRRDPSGTDLAALEEEAELRGAYLGLRRKASLRRVEAERERVRCAGLRLEQARIRTVARAGHDGFEVEDAEALEAAADRCEEEARSRLRESTDAVTTSRAARADWEARKSALGTRSAGGESPYLE